MTEQGGSQARFLLCKVNPSQTHNNAMFGGVSGFFHDVEKLELNLFFHSSEMRALRGLCLMK